MLPQSERDHILKKSYEVAYALFRVAARLTGTFPEKIRDAAISLLDSGVGEDPEKISGALKVVEYFVKFAGDVNLIAPANVDVLLREVNALNAAIKEYCGKTIESVHSDLDVSAFFSNEVPLAERVKKVTTESADIRQSVILEKIRQNDNCRLRDLQEMLPDSSERTIRYDLQYLLEKNLIERVGAGGPSIYYRAR